MPWVIIVRDFVNGDYTLLTFIQAAGWPIWPLLACSILAMALIVDRFINLKPAKIAPAKLTDEAIGVCQHGIPPSETIAQLAQSSLLGAVLASGCTALERHPRCSEADLRATMEGAGRRAAQQLEKHMVSLATIASAAPLLGLLGTVIGMI